MKASIKTLLLLPALIASFGFMQMAQVTAQTITTLHSFTPTSGFPDFANDDGVNPSSGLILLTNTLYGTAQGGGSSGGGTVFSVNTDGTGFTPLHSFTFGGDGATPYAGLIFSGDTLYGTTVVGGSSGKGTIFKVNTDGTGFATVYSFNGSDGAYPYAGLILSNNTLYGTTVIGGSSDKGTIFKVNTDGMGFTNLHSFTAGANDSSGFYTNSDGANPYAGLILSGSTLYGTAHEGGASGKGTVFKVSIDGTAFTTLHAFVNMPTNSPNPSEAGFPYAGLVLSGNTLYGTASDNSSTLSTGYGAVFAVDTNGTGFTNLHSFTFGSDGATPYAGLILSNSTLFGTTVVGGSSGNGTVYKINTDGTAFSTVYNFTGSDGANPEASLIFSGNTFYGTTWAGGTSSNGTVFRLSPGSVSARLLKITRAEPNVILTWPTNAIGFTLQSTTNLISTAAWTPVSPGPTVVNGQNTVTNPIAGKLKFYRLSQ